MLRLTRKGDQKPSIAWIAPTRQALGELLSRQLEYLPPWSLSLRRKGAGAIETSEVKKEESSHGRGESAEGRLHAREKVSPATRQLIETYLDGTGTPLRATLARLVA